MKVLISTTIKIKEHYPNFREWESAMIEKYGKEITSKTNEIWNLILVKEKELLNNPEFKNDAIKLRNQFDDYYKWQSALIEKYGKGIQNHLYSVWMETKKALIEEKKRETLINTIDESYLSDEEGVLLKSLFWLKIISIILLSLSLLKLPIGYYTFLRIIVCGISGFSAYTYYTGNRTIWLWLFGFIALLFNPIIPLYFGKSVWSVIDIFTAVLFVISIIALKEFPYRTNNKLN